MGRLQFKQPSENRYSSDYKANTFKYPCTKVSPLSIDSVGLALISLRFTFLVIASCLLGPS